MKAFSVSLLIKTKVSFRDLPDLLSSSITQLAHERNQHARQAPNPQWWVPLLDPDDATLLPRPSLPPHPYFLFTKFLLILTSFAITSVILRN